MHGSDASQAILVLVDAKTGDTTRLGANVVHSVGPGKSPNIQNDYLFAGGSELGDWSADGKWFYISLVQGSGAKAYNRIGRIALSDPDKVELLTPEGVNSRYPSLAPGGSSFVYIATSKKLGESPVQIFEGKVKAGPKGAECECRQVTHLPPGWVPNYPYWRAMTSVPVDPLP